jgi:protein-tyrosine phosphatase
VGEDAGVIDLHFHILPGLDDGPETMEGSVKLARAAAEAGTAVVAATPHVRADYPYDVGRIAPAVEELNRVLRSAGVGLEVVTGGEVAITELTELDRSVLDRVSYAGGPYVLVESPYTQVGQLLERTLFEAQLAGLRPVLAHPERSPCFHDDLDRLAEIVSRGVACSITAGSMAGRFGPAVKEVTAKILERGLAHDVASDAHSLGRRPPGLRAGFEVMEEELPGILAQMDWYTIEVPGAILAGEMLPPRPAPLRRRSSSLAARLRSALGR